VDPRAGHRLWGDIELAWRVRDKVLRADGTPAEWVLITGTNGKTTTTQLTATMLVAGGLRAAPCGNIGVPMLDAVRDPGSTCSSSSSPATSSGTSHCGSEPVSPFASVCLNLADDHLQWHGSFAAYRDAKAVVYRTRASPASTTSPTSRPASWSKKPMSSTDAARSASISGCRAERSRRRRRHRRRPRLPGGSAHQRAGDHDAGRARRAGSDRAAHRGEHPRRVRAGPLARCGARAHRGGPCEFRLDAHRIEVVATAGGITWIDDSKATNPHAAASSLAAFPGAVWVVGGDMKGVDIGDLVAARGPSVKAVIVIGVERADHRRVRATRAGHSRLRSRPRSD
jgi:UDP-N-acetylmuramoylalanine--D-glutamate ligase